MVTPTGSPEAQPGQEAPPVTPAATQFGTATPAPSTYTKESEALAMRKEASRVGKLAREKFNVAELKTVESDATATAAIKARQDAELLIEQAEERHLEATATEQSAQRILTDAQAIIANTRADVLVTQYGVDKARLLLYSSGNVDLMEQVAKDLPKVDPNQPQTPLPAAAPAAPASPLVPDNSVNQGGGGINVESLTKAGLKDMNPTQLAEASTALQAKARALAITS